MSLNADDPVWFSNLIQIGKHFIQARYAKEADPNPLAG